MTQVPSLGDTNEFKALTPEALSPLAFYLLDFIHDPWQTETRVMMWTIKGLAAEMGIPPLQLSRVLNGFSRSFPLENLRKVQRYFQRFGMAWEALLLAQLGYYAPHPTVTALLASQEDGMYLRRLLAWVNTNEWYTDGGYWRHLALGWLEAPATSNLDLLDIVRPVAAYIRCWLAEDLRPNTTTEERNALAAQLAPPKK